MQEFAKGCTTSPKAKAWLEGDFKVDDCPKETIDELVHMTKIAKDKNKIALIDLMRLLVLTEVQANYVFS